MTTGAADQHIGIEEGAQLVERKAQQYFGLSADEFGHRWDAGELRADDDPHALEVALLLPLARP